MRVLDVIAAVLVVIGGLNWGLVGLFQFDLVAALFGQPGVIGATWMLPRLIYVVVGIAAVYQALSVKGIQHRWGQAPKAA